jgi:PRTRC genetic system protein E
MENTFFQNLSELLTDGCLKLVVKKGEGDILIVSVLPTNDKVGDNAKNAITPLVLKDTPQALDAGFFDAITEPISSTNQLFVNMEAHLKSVEQARLESKLETDRQKAEKTAKEERKKKYDLLVKKVDELETDKKYKEAIDQLERATDLTEHTDEIKKRLSELKSKSQPSLF